MMQKAIIFSFRKNDLDPSKGKQIEFNSAKVEDFFNFTSSEVNLTFRYVQEGSTYNGTRIKTYLKLSPERRDYKIYQNTDGSPDLKDFFRSSLGLNEQRNINDYFALKKVDESNYDFFYFPQSTTIDVVYKALKLDKSQVICDIENSSKNDSSVAITNRTFEEPRQLIYFGAPGTGKSYSLNKDALASFGKIVYSKEQRIERFKQSKFIDAAKNYDTYIGKNILEEHGFDAYAEDSLAVLNKKLQELETLKKASKDDQDLYHNLNNRCSALKAYIKFAETIFVDSVERVTFHPNYSYAQFVGTYKPVSSGYSGDLTDEEIRRIVNILQDTSKAAQEKYDLLYPYFKDGDMLTRLPVLLGLYSDEPFATKKMDGTATANNNSVERNHGVAIRPYVTLGLAESISYMYVPGPFMRTLVNALNNLEKDFLLIIEEINRANVAAVFGDVFQLLDRHGSGEHKGESEYPVAASEDIKRYLRENGIQDCNELKIPSNMYIWATMNSADQGVFPMDTAFKRRWEFEYIGINENETWDYTIPLPKNESINWNILRRAINSSLKKIASVNEDKLLGPYFLSKAVLEDANKWNSEQDSKDKQKAVEKFLNTFKSKVLMYLYEDVCKMRPGDVFKIKLEDGQTRLHYSDICDAFDKIGIGIFGFEKADIEDKYKQKI